MTIRTKLVLTYLLLVGFVGAATGIGLPRWVEAAVIRAEQDRLIRQSQWVADRLSSQARTRFGNLGLAQTLNTVEELLADETVAIVDPNGLIVRSSRRELQGESLPVRPERRPEERTLFRPSLLGMPALTVLTGVGPVIIAQTTLTDPQSPLRGYSVVLIRDRAFIQDLARPITRNLYTVIAMMLLAALMIAGWVSRDLVRRLQATGQAARALADGDLSHRAPENGHDEITELAGHFNHMAERIEALVAGLRRSETARRDLLVTVSHELRTPMTSISGFAEALLDGVVTDEERKQRYYRIIVGEAGRLNRLINDLFDVAKLDAGQLELRLQAMPVAPWLIEFAESYRPVVETAQGELSLQFSEEGRQARIYGDRDRLDQVLGNLVSNALRFNPVGGLITIAVRIEGDDLRIAVNDQGPGVSPEDADRLFDRFYQGKNRGTTDHTGAGLGLSIVKSLVEAHGGAAGVQSNPGEGATFWFSLKLLRAE